MSRRALCAATGLAAAVLLGACSSNGETDAGTVPPTTLPPRPNQYDSCQPSGIVAPPTMHLVDRELPNLGHGMLGRLERYEGDGARLTIAVGADVLDAYEDLDFQTVADQVGELPATVSKAGAFGSGDLLVVLTWRDPATVAPCNRLSLVGTNLSADQLVALAEAPRAPAAAPTTTEH